MKTLPLLLVSLVTLGSFGSLSAQQQNPYQPGGPYPHRMGQPSREALVVPGRTLGLRPYLFVEQYDLEETSGGSRFVSEEGQFYGIGLNWSAGLTPRLRLDALLEGFIGEVDYSGGLQNLFTGEITPLEDDTDYLGVRVETNVVMPYSLANGMLFEPFLGLGLRSFSRDLGSPSEGGYVEDWTSIYALLGTGLIGDLSPQSQWFAKGALAYPLYNVNSTDRRGSADDLEPGRELFWFAELGLRRGRLEAAAFWKFYQFSASDSVTTNQGLFSITSRQPATDISMIGLRLGWTF